MDQLRKKLHLTTLQLHRCQELLETQVARCTITPSQAYTLDLNILGSLYQRRAQVDAWVYCTASLVNFTDHPCLLLFRLMGGQTLELPLLTPAPLTVPAQTPAPLTQTAPTPAPLTQTAPTPAPLTGALPSRREELSVEGPLSG